MLANYIESCEATPRPGFEPGSPPRFMTFVAESETLASFLNKRRLSPPFERVISLASRRTGLLSMVSRGLGLSFGSQTNELKVVKLFARRTGLPYLRRLAFSL